MQEDRDVNFARLEQRLDSPAGRGASKLVLILFGAVVTALLGAINYNLQEANAHAMQALQAANTERDTNFAQARDLALLNARVDAIERKTDAQISALQALTLQVTRNGDAIEHTQKGGRG